jgi:pimeloyl-ACP methyl ester carboxylesterase
VIRGTATGYDGWTDAVGAFARSPSGHAVHSGFNTCYRSFRHTLMGWFEKNRDITTVHCVGHSLGAALATLAADDLSSYGKRVALYTFGSPRVGTDFYASFMAKKLGTHNYRVHNRADPVTMVGPWMYTHLRGAHLTLPWDNGSIDFSAHKMANYIRGVGKSAWANLSHAATHRAQLEADVRALLDTPSTGGGITMYSTTALSMIAKCLGWLLEKTATFVGAGALVHLTVLDQLSYLVHAAGSLPTPGAAVATVLGWIMKFLGRGAETVKDATMTFVRWCMGMFLNVISSMAQRAMYHAYYFPQI